MQLHIKLRQLEIFCAIIATGSAVAAGKKIGLSQSAISSALKALENQLNEPLFERVGKRLICNEQGKQFYLHALDLLEQAYQLEQLFVGDVGRLHIAASTTIGNYLLPPILAAFKKVYPKITVRVTIANTNDVIEKVAQLDCDMGLVEGGCLHPDITTHIWRYDELVWFSANPSELISRNKAISLKTLLAKPLIVRETGSGTQQLLETALSQYGLSLNHNDTLQLIELGNSEAIKEAVRHDLGIGCLSRHAIAEFLELGLVDEIVTQEPNTLRPLLIIQQNHKHNGKLLSIFKDFLITIDEKSTKN